MGGKKTYETALLFRDLGVSTVPIDPKKKRPPGAGAAASPLRGQAAAPAVAAALVPRAGLVLALVCGVTLAVRDFDRAEAYHRWAGEHPDLAGRLPTAATRRGFHVYHRCGFEHWQKLPDGEYIASPRHYVLASAQPPPQGRPLPLGGAAGRRGPAGGPVAAGLLPDACHCLRQARGKAPPYRLWKVWTRPPARAASRRRSAARCRRGTGSGTTACGASPWP